MMIVVALFVSTCIFYVKPTTSRIVGCGLIVLRLGFVSCFMLAHTHTFDKFHSNLVFHCIVDHVCHSLMCHRSVCTEVCAQSCVTVDKTKIFWPWEIGGELEEHWSQGRLQQNSPSPGSAKAAFTRTCIRT